MGNYTPKFNGARVRIPVTRRRWNHDGTVVTIRPGRYPVIENGATVTKATPRVELAGDYLHERASCGLRCMCDATITKIGART